MFVCVCVSVADFQYHCLCESYARRRSVTVSQPALTIFQPFTALVCLPLVAWLAWMTDFEAFADAVSDENTISSDLIRWVATNVLLLRL